MRQLARSGQDFKQLMPSGGRVDNIPPTKERKDKQKMLENNEKIKAEILKNGLKLEKTTEQLNQLCDTLPEVVNLVNIHNLKETGEIRVHLIHHDAQTNNYKYLDDEYNDRHGWTLKAYPETNHAKQLLLIINNSIELHKADFLKAGKPTKDYFIKELENNRPLTLLKAKNNNFVEFVALAFYSDNSLMINTFNMNEYKDELKSEKTLISNNYWNPDDARKHAFKIYAIYNKNWVDFLAAEQIKTQKRIDRNKNKLFLKSIERYFYNDDDFNRFTSQNYNLTLWGCSYNSLLKNEFDTLSSKKLTFNGCDYWHNCETRKELYNFLFDKNGFFKLPKIHELKQRAETLKRQREQERKEKLKAEWINADHTEQQKNIDEKLMILKALIIKYSTFDYIIAPYGIKRLDTLKELYNNYKELNDFNRFKDVENWNAKQEEINKKYLFECSIISQNIFDRVGCYHQYEETETGYKMTDKYINDKYWGERYLHEFARVEL